MLCALITRKGGSGDTPEPPELKCEEHMKASSTGLGRDFWIFRAGQLISAIGDGCASIAFMWWLLDKTGSAEKMAMVLAPVSLARIFLIPLLGPLGDRYSRKKIVILSDAWRGIMFLLLAVFAGMNIFYLPAVMCLFVLTTAGTALFSTVSGSIIAQLVDTEKLGTAIERSNSIVAIGGVAGGIIGSIAVNYFGVTGAFVINSISFFAAAVASCWIRKDIGGSSKIDSRAMTAINAWAEQLKAGFSVVIKVPIQLWLCVLAAVINCAVAPVSVALPVLVKESGALSPGFIGILTTAMGIGAIVGSLGVGWVCRKVFADKVIFCGMALMGINLAALFLLPGTATGICIMLLLGISIMLVNVPMNVKLMTATPDNYRSRVNSVSAFISQAAVPAGTALAGMVAAGWGMGFMMVVAGAVVVVMSPLVFLIPKFSIFFRMSEEETHEFFLKKYPEAFSQA